MVVTLNCIEASNRLGLECVFGVGEGEVNRRLAKGGGQNTSIICTVNNARHVLCVAHSVAKMN